MAKGKDVRHQVILECTEAPGTSRYSTTKLHEETIKSPIVSETYPRRLPLSGLFIRNFPSRLYMRRPSSCVGMMGQLS